MDNIGMVDSSRLSNKGKSMFADVYDALDGEPARVFRRQRSDYNSLFVGADYDQRELRDEVHSFRTGPSAELTSVDQQFLDAKRSNPLTKNDTGHEFDLHTYAIRNPSLRYVHIEDEFSSFGGARHRWGYKGPIGFFGYGNVNNDRTMSGHGTHFYANGDVHSDIDISLGAKAIAAVAPTKSEANVAASLLELKDGFPKMIGKSLRTDGGTQAIGSEYLNFVFGWLPTISDVRDIARAMVNASKIINQYNRDADRIVRRRFGFPYQDTYKNYTDALPGVRLSPLLPSYSDIPNGLWGNDGRWVSSSGSYDVTLVEAKQKHVWFSGAFRYHLATGDDVFSRIDRTGQVAAKWLGARADAKAFWQAMPWSWFIDWISDVGAIVDNANAAALDGQVLQWGYLMQHTLYKRTLMTNAGVVYNYSHGGSLNVGNLATTGVTERKQRVKATPFGFGLNPDSFSAQQWAILGALGMTRGPSRLW